MAQVVSAERTRAGGSGSFITFVNSAFRGNYKIPLLDYQTYGIRSTTLWPTEPQCMRIIPGYDSNTGEIFHQNPQGLPYVKDCDPAEYTTDTICMARTMAKLGRRKHAVVTSYRPGSEEAMKWGGNTVLSEFASIVIHAVNAVKDGKTSKVQPGPDWSGWVSYNPNTQTSPILSYDRDTMLFQALVWQLNGRMNEGANRQQLVDPDTGVPLPMLYVIAIDNSLTIKEMWKALIEPQDPTKPIDGLNNSIYKGIAEQEGSILYLNPSAVKEKDKKRNLLMPHVSSDMSSWVNTPYPLTDEQIKFWWHPWDEILNYMTPDEQCELLAEEFGADTVNYVLGKSAILGDLRIPDKVACAGVGKYAAIDGGRISVASRPTVASMFPGAPVSPAASPAASRPTPTMAQPPAFIPPAMPGTRPAAPSPAAPQPTSPTGDKVFVSPAVSNPSFAQQLQGIRAASKSNQSELQKYAQDLAGNDEEDSSFADDPWLGGGNGTV